MRLAVQMAKAEAASATGELAVAINITRSALTGPLSSVWTLGIRILSYAALLARDHEALRYAADLLDRVQQRAPGPDDWIHTARHRLHLLEGRPSELNTELRDANDRWPLTTGTLWLEAREAIDAGAPHEALDDAHKRSRPLPHSQAVLAAVEAAATDDEDRWHDALAIALDQGLRLVAVDALEGLAVAAARVERWPECLRLAAAAERLRDETGYRWRFGFEQRAVDSARTDALSAIGDDADAAIAEGHNLDWHDAAAGARRVRGERR
jgi:hypothetical protein